MLCFIRLDLVRLRLRLKIGETTKHELFQINYPEAMKAIKGLRERFGGSSLFGNEKDESFQGSLAAIYQTFGGKDLYPSVEEKAAHLLYFVTKNHSFLMGTSGSQPSFLCGSWKRTAFCTGRTARRE